MKILIITQKYGQSEVGGRRWFLFEKELSKNGFFVEVDCFINLSRSDANVHNHRFAFLNFLWSDNGKLFKRALSKIIRTFYPNLKKSLLERWIKKFKYRSFDKYQSVIISVPDFNLLKIAQYNGLRNYKGCLILDCRDPLYLTNLDAIPGNFKNIINVSDQITKNTKEIISSSNNQRFHTIHNCVSKIDDLTDIKSKHDKNYLIFFGTLYSDIQAKFFEIFDAVLSAHNKKNTTNKLKLRLYIGLDLAYFRARGIYVNSQNFELLDYKKGDEFEDTIRMAKGGIIPLWSGRYEGYGTKFLDYLKMNKNFLIIQDRVQKSEFYQKFQGSQGILFSDWDKNSISAELDKLLNVELSVDPHVLDQFSLLANTQKLIDIIEA